MRLVKKRLCTNVGQAFLMRESIDPLIVWKESEAVERPYALHKLRVRESGRNHVLRTMQGSACAHLPAMWART